MFLKFLPFLKLRLCGPLQTYCPLGSVASMLKVEDCLPTGPLPLPSRGPASGRHWHCQPSPASGWAQGGAEPLPAGGGDSMQTIPAPPPQVLALSHPGTRRWPCRFPDSAHSCEGKFFFKKLFSNYPIWLCHLSPAWTLTEPWLIQPLLYIQQDIEKGFKKLTLCLIGG